jgi:photosystem II stability/assembly factor-like uncharacterized protein
MKYYRLFTFLAALVVCATTAVSGDDSARVVSTNATGNEVRQWEVTGPWGGDVRALVPSPANSDEFYLGTADGQIFHTLDGARTWKRLKPGLEKRGLSVDSIVIDPKDPKIIYAGVWAVARDEEGGVFKSTDGGEHWKLLEGTKKLSVRSLALAPSDSNFLIAGTANDDPKLNGVFRSIDAGKNWERISPIGDGEIRNIESAAIDPRDTNVIYVGTWHLPWKTINGGASWKQSGNQIVGMINDSDIFGITIDPKQPNTVYVNACSGFYRSTNAGEKWFKFPGIPFSARRTYVLLPHPTNSSVIFAGTSEGLWRSKDGGKKWMLLTSKTLVIRSIVVTADKPNRVVIATDDFGIRISENLGIDFSDSNTGFSHRHVLAIMPDVTEHGHLLASVFHDGSGGSVFASADGGESWIPSSTGLAGRDVFSFYQMPDNPNVIYAGTNTGVYRSTDRGTSWAPTGVEQPKPAEKPPAKPARSRLLSIGGSSAIGRYETVAISKRTTSQKSKKPVQKKTNKEKPKPVGTLAPGFVQLGRQVDDITSFADAEGRIGLLAATMDGLFRTFDDSKGWEPVTIDGYPTGGPVFSISTHKDTPRKILAGTKHGLFISNDGSQSWQRAERGPDDVSVKAIAQDPQDAQIIVLGTNQYIFRSTNGGRTWARRGGGLPSGDFTSVVFSPTNPNEVMAAEYSRGGVYRSMDKGYIWERVDVELPSNRVWTLSFDPFDKDRVYLGSFSSGVYVFTTHSRTSLTGQQ